MPSARASLSTALFLVFGLLAGCTTPLGNVSIESVTPSSATTGDTTRITLRGSGFYMQDRGGQPRLDGLDIRVCGVSLTDLQYGELERQTVAIAPGGAQTVVASGFISGLLGEGAVAGPSDVVVTVPLTGSATIKGAFECLEPLPPKPENPDEPDQPLEPEPANPGIAIEPAGAELLVGESRQFTATVRDLEDDSVVWSLTGVGSISDSSANPVNYQSDEEGEATLTVTSAGNPELSASVQLSVAYPELSVAIEPGSGTMYPEQQQTYVATVDGWSDTSVSWQVNGDPTQPATVDGNELTLRTTTEDVGSEFTLTATSVANPAKSASVSVTVVAYPITVSPASVTLAPGESVELTASSSDPGDFDYEWSATVGSLSGPTGSTVTYTAPVHFDPAAEVSVSVTSPGDPEGAAVAITVESRFKARQYTLFSQCPRQLLLGTGVDAWYALGNDHDCANDALNTSWSIVGGQLGSRRLSEIRPDAHAVPHPDGSLFIVATSSDCGPLSLGFYDWINTQDASMRLCYGVNAGSFRIVDMRPMTDTRSLILAEIGPGGGRTYDLTYVDHTPSSISVRFTRSSITIGFVPVALWYSEGQTIVAGRVGSATVLERFEPDVDGELTGLDSLQVNGPGSLSPTAVTIDANGDILLAAIAVDGPGAESVMRLYKLAGTNGDAIWQQELGPTGALGVTGIAIDGDGTIYLAGQSQEPGQESELFVAAMDGDGGQLWREQFRAPGLGMTASTELLFRYDDTLIVAGYQGPGDLIDGSFVMELNLD